MIRDSYKKEVGTLDSIKMRAPIETEKLNKDVDEKKHWRITDVITFADGSQKVLEHVNTVVDDCSRLIACLMKGHEGFSGITYWAVGKGEASWSNENPPAPLEEDSVLLEETFRKAINPEDITFIDAEDNPTESITNRIQVKVEFEEHEANGELREFGLFGGNATETKDSGLMINRKTHGLIYKTSGMRLERIIRITF